MSRLRRLRARWRSHTAPRRAPEEQRRARLDDPQAAALLRELRQYAEGRGGDARALAHAAALKASYTGLTRAGRRQFLVLIATELGLDRDRITDLAQAMLDAEGDDRRAAEDALRRAFEAPWLPLLRHFNRLPDGTRFLVDLRADLLRFAERDPLLAPLERDLKRLLQTWFDVGFLELRRVTWNSSASLLERLARSEAVHTVAGWDDLKHRLEADRRFFACFHPRMPDDPLTFVEVALTKGTPREIRAVLDQRAPSVEPTAADTAVFYSISNVEKGLRGIPFGGYVIHSVVDELLAELPQLRTFATISPIPGFRAWLDRQPAAVGGRFSAESVAAALAPGAAAGEADELREPLLRLCATYLLGDTDPVLRFHLSNGARLDRISWAADLSPRGIAQSAGIMAHYVYELDRLEANHDAFVHDREVVASDQIRRLAGRQRRAKEDRALGRTG